MMKRWLMHDVVVAGFCLVVYLLTNGYMYGWDDQHLEIPLLKHLIDPSLYQGDYYVEALSRHFTSFLYPLLARVITVDQIPAVYFGLFLLSRYVMFYWVYRLWLLISHNRFAAISATVMFFVSSRTEEFLYRTFSHQEFCYIFMFAGIYYFYRDRYLVAALLFGLGANFHAVYNLFPMLYMLAFLLCCHPRRLAMVIKTGLVFVAGCSPFLFWQVFKSMTDPSNKVVGGEWHSLFLQTVPEAFLFHTASVHDVFRDANLGWEKLAPYGLLTGLYALHCVFNPRLRQDKRIHVMLVVSWVLIAILYVFTYVYPNRYVLILNLFRVEQFVRFFLMGYTALWAVTLVEDKKPWLALVGAGLFVAVGVSDLIGLACVGLCFMLFTIDYVAHTTAPRWKIMMICAAALLAGGLSLTAAQHAITHRFEFFYWLRFICIAIVVPLSFLGVCLKPSLRWLRRLLIMIPLFCSIVHLGVFHAMFYNIKDNAQGFWKLQRNWLDMQHYVRDHTPKGALILTPYDTDMGGFRIHSERKVLVCQRDCGVIGFDFNAAKEWQQRMKDIEPFKVFANQPIQGALMTAILTYGISDVVFMRRFGPLEDSPMFKKIYENEVFSLFHVVY